jgi:tetratricopeptide (TPR) repeat protein
MLTSALLWASLSLANEPTMADLQEGQALAWSIVGRCRAESATCRDARAQQRLGKAFFTIVLDDVVHGRPVDASAAANVAHLHPALSARLPSDVRSALGEPAAWVVALSAPMPTPQPSPVVEAPPEPIPQKIDYAGAIALLRSGAHADASTVLWPMTQTGDELRAWKPLTHALRDLDMPAAALVVLADAPAHANDVWPLDQRTADAVALAQQMGTRRPLVALAAAHHPEHWSPSTQGDALLAYGTYHQERGSFSPALKAYAQLSPSDAAWVHGEFQRGMIYWQTGDPWAALRAFRNVSETEQTPRDLDSIREMAVWNVAALYEELDRVDDAIATWEVLTITRSALSDRAALRCAWAAHLAGDKAESNRWMPDRSTRGIFTPELAALQARKAIDAGDTPRARTLLDQAVRDIEVIDASLGSLLDDLGDLWVSLQQHRDPVLADRLAADPTLSAWRLHLAAIEADRARIQTMPQAWRSTVGVGLDTRLAQEAHVIRAKATTSAYYTVSAVRRELERLSRQADRSRQHLRP